MTITRLAKRIAEAFTATEPPDDITGSVVEGDLERQEVTEFFRNRHWRDLSFYELERQHEALFLMSPAGLTFFLPAFLIYAIREHESSSVRSALVAELYQPDRPEQMHELAGVLDPVQIEVIRDSLRVIQYAKARVEGIDNIDVAIDYWERVLRIRGASR